MLIACSFPASFHYAIVHVMVISSPLALAKQIRRFIGVLLLKTTVQSSGSEAANLSLFVFNDMLNLISKLDTLLIKL